MAITKDQKVEILKELTDKFGQAKGVVFAKYSGLSVSDAQALRRGLRAAGVDYKVAKKTLINLAAKEHGLEVSADVLDGPIGVAFGFDDEIVAAQKMAEFAKKFPGLSLTGGVMDGKVIDAAMVNTLSSIPSHDVLIAKFMGSAMSPLSSFVGIGNALVGGLVRVLNAYREQQGEVPVEAAPSPEPQATSETEADAEVAPEPATEEAPAGDAEEAPKADEATDAPEEEPPADAEAEAAPETEEVAEAEEEPPVEDEKADESADA